ncbi:hypothetical protein [Pararhodobacter sp. CCB-MM2]|uniref:hypothetical protein n=1 Tax=Pararhodobacter sp. CCB-MM2 TaxID=1786003 RepID=UPI00083269BA|nr:hypothetical protein [Pararhodobacter sp. CCB-MM2]
MTRTIFALLACVAATPALADEVWDTNMGEIAWLETRGPDAYLGVVDPDGTTSVHLMVPGLGADMMGGRGTYTGVWVAGEGDVACVTDMVAPDGSKSSYWGSFTITFVNDDFPSDFAGAYGDCLDLPSMPLQAHARYAQ